MADHDGRDAREAGRRGGRTRPVVLAPTATAGSGTAPPPALAGGWSQSLDRLRSRAGQLLSGALSAEAGPGRLILWSPIAFGTGIIAYFSAEQEPALWAALTLAVAGAVLAVTLRARSLGFAVAVLAFATAAGFAAATSRTALVAHPVLERPLFGAEVTGWVVSREQRERSDRIVVNVDRLTAPRFEGQLERIRVAARKGTAPPVGSYVSFKARLNPPLGPLRPGGYDYARDLYFKGIAASGFVLGRIEQPETPSPPAFSVSVATRVAAWREAVDARIRASATGDSGAIASALITGKRDAIAAATHEAMYVSSLGHVLAISGYHMAVVAGAIFFAVRALLALFPPLALRWPIRKWAAAVALVAASAYLVLSGAAIATQRAYLMTTVVLVGVMLDRPSLTLRTLAVAALALLSLSPEALIHPSFQMSFAATLALVAAYERGLPWMVAGAGTPLGARVALWGGREILAVLVASLVAGGATTLFAAYHFHRLAPYGMLANLLVMPVMSAWVMPSGLLALALMPLGFDGPLWRLMATGIDWMTAVAMFVAGLPGAVGRITAFGPGPLLGATAGLVILCLLRSPLRWSGVAIAVFAIAMAARTPQPDILVAPGAEVVAVRGAGGEFSVRRLGTNAFAVRAFLAADGDARDPADPGLGAAFACDPAGCTARLADGRIVALALTAEAFAEDCEKAALIVTRRSAPPGCAAAVIDRNLWHHSGAVALFAEDGGFTVTMARPRAVARPWAPAWPAAQRGAETADATPAESDLTADD